MSNVLANFTNAIDKSRIINSFHIHAWIVANNMLVTIPLIMTPLEHIDKMHDVPKVNKRMAV